MFMDKITMLDFFQNFKLEHYVYLRVYFKRNFINLARKL